MHTVTGVIQRLQRRLNSQSGNPRFTVHLANGAVLRTATNANCAHVIDNSEYVNTPVQFTLDRYGEITHIKALAAEDGQIGRQT